MTIVQAIILGIVQGLTEFLPVSSSGHLNLFPWIFKWGQMPDSFDVALHLGTLLALAIYFFKDWISLIKGGYKSAIKKEKSTEGKIFWYLVAGTIPAGILSLVLDDEKLALVRKDVVIIDLASNPGGVDIKAAKNRGLKLIWALSISGKVAPLTSAEYIVETLYHVLKEL